MMLENIVKCDVHLYSQIMVAKGYNNNKKIKNLNYNYTQVNIYTSAIFYQDFSARCYA